MTLVLVTCATLAALSATAPASTVYVQRATVDDTGLGIGYHGTNNGGSRTNWWGGERLMRVSSSPDFSSYDVIGVFCFEPYADLFNYPNTGEYTLGTLADFGVNAQQKDLLLKLADNAYPVLLDNNTPDDFAVKATAYQVVVWEILNDAGANPLSLSNGLTRVDYIPGGGSNQDPPWVGDMRDLANSWIGQLNSGSWSTTGQYEYRMLLSDDWQALGYLVEVPEPSTMVLAGLGLIGIVMLRRRRG